MKFNAFKQKVEGLPLFSSSQINTLSDRPATLTVQLAQWKKKGLLRSLRRGLYVLCPAERRVEPSRFFLGNQLFIPSYISLESALAHHHLIPEFVAATTSVTVRKTCRFENEFGVFTYQHIRSEAYEGFTAVPQSDAFQVLVASPEKAVVDFLYLNLEKFKPGDRAIFTESYRFQNAEDLNPKAIEKFAKMFGSKKLLLICRMFIQEVIR